MTPLGISKYNKLSVLPEWALVYDEVNEVVICGDGVHTVQQLAEKKLGKKAPRSKMDILCDKRGGRKKNINPDVNKDGKVDEKDLSIVHEEHSKQSKGKA